MQNTFRVSSIFIPVQFWIKYFNKAGFLKNVKEIKKKMQHNLSMKTSYEVYFIQRTMKAFK